MYMQDLYIFILHQLNCRVKRHSSIFRPPIIHVYTCMKEWMMRVYMPTTWRCIHNMHIHACIYVVCSMYGYRPHTGITSVPRKVTSTTTRGRNSVKQGTGGWTMKGPLNGSFPLLDFLFRLVIFMCIKLYNYSLYDWNTCTPFVNEH